MSAAGFPITRTIRFSCIRARIADREIREASALIVAGYFARGWLDIREKAAGLASGAQLSASEFDIGDGSLAGRMDAYSSTIDQFGPTRTDRLDGKQRSLGTLFHKLNDSTTPRHNEGSARLV
jgi:hypothetical protein